jgi:type II secretory pathway predicted ATPase ExeA
MYRQHFGLTHAPLGKECKVLWGSHQLEDIDRQFKWLLKAPGVGLLTAEPGLGKTAALRQLTRDLNPHQYLVRYIAETDFGRLDFYRQLAQSLGLHPSFRRIDLWRSIKEHVTQLATQKNILPILIIDEAQNLSQEFLRDFPSFLNFVFDSKDYITVWLAGHMELARTLDRANNAALSSRIQARCALQPVNNREEFNQLVAHGFAEAGCVHTLLSDSGIDLLRMASKGNPRQVHRLLVASLQLATDKKMNHLSDDTLKEAIEILKQG